MFDLYLMFSAPIVFLGATNLAVIKTFGLREGFMEGWRLSIPFLLCVFGGVIFLVLIGALDDEASGIEGPRVYFYLTLVGLGFVVSALHNRAYMERRYEKKISIRLALLLNLQVMSLIKIFGVILWIPFFLIAIPFNILFGSA